jgi:protein involved in polysaccharide export with SLBB domain
MSPSSGLIVRLAAFLFPTFCALALSHPSLAQQFPGIDQVQQALQRQGGSQNSGSASPQPDILIQPAVPANPMQRQPPSRLEQILSSRAGTRLTQFGYDRFGVGQAVLVPQTGAVQDDYILGAGDEIVVSLRGQENSELRAAVDRNGQVTLPRLSPIAAAGRNFGSFRDDLQSAVHRAFVATSAFVSIGHVRQISVLVAGEVNNPGQRLVTGLSSAVDAILLSGGVKKSGSLRDIRIVRNGREIRVDLYNVLTARGGPAELRLADGDRVVVPMLGPTVAVSGLVRQPGIFELPPRQSGIPVRALLALAGGQEVRGNYRMSVLRVMPDGHTELVLATTDSSMVRDSEILFVQLASDYVGNQATLSGGTGLAGPMAVTGGSRLSEYLRAPGALGASPYTLLGIISRRNSTSLMRELVAFTPVSVMNGTENGVLNSDDIVRPVSVNEAQMMTNAVCTFLANQQSAREAQRNPTANDISFAGGGAKSTSTDTQDQGHVDAYRGCSQNEGRARVFSVQSGNGQLTTVAQRPFVDQYGDALPEYYIPAPVQGQVQQPAQPFQNLGQNGSDPQQSGMPAANGASEQLNGELRRLPPYDYPMEQSPLTRLAPNFQDQSLQPGQIAPNREATRFADLARQLGVTELVLVNFLIDHQVVLNGAVRGPGSYFVGPTVNLPDLVLAAGGTANWADASAVEVTSTAVDTQSGRSITSRLSLSKPAGTYAQYRVRPQDVFRFNAVYANNDNGTVTVQGEVRSPGSFQIRRGEKLSELLARAGGLTGTAFPYGAVFLRKSVANMEHESYLRAAKEAEDQLLVAMTRVGSDKISPDTFTAMQGFITDLRGQKAIGRISVNADPSILATRPNQDMLLEPDDIIYIPQRPSTISVLGQVRQPGSYLLKPGMAIRDYISLAGGYSPTAEESDAYVVFPDGTSRKVETSWLSFKSNDLPPGSSIVVPRDVTPLDTRQIIIDTSQILSQLAVSIASVAVLSR